MNQINSFACGPKTEYASSGPALTTNANWNRMRLTGRLMLSLLIALVLTGCGHERQVEKLGGELTSLTAGMSLAIDANPTVDGATKAHEDFNSKRKSLLEKWDKLRAVKLTVTEKTRLILSISDSRNYMTECAAKHTDERLVSEPFNQAMESLIKDFEATFNPADLQ
jgi:hypothetical protein